MKLKKFTLDFNSTIYEKGSERTLRVDENGIPLDRFWRNRLKEGGILVLKPKKSTQSEKKYTALTESEK